MADGALVKVEWRHDAQSRPVRVRPVDADALTLLEVSIYKRAVCNDKQAQIARFEGATVKFTIVKCGFGKRTIRKAAVVEILTPYLGLCKLETAKVFLCIFELSECLLCHGSLCQQRSSALTNRLGGCHLVGEFV